MALFPWFEKDNLEELLAMPEKDFARWYLGSMRVYELTNADKHSITCEECKTPITRHEELRRFHGLVLCPCCVGPTFTKSYERIPHAYTKDDRAYWERVASLRL